MRNEGQTNTTKQTVAFHNFTNAPKKVLPILGNFQFVRRPRRFLLDFSVAFGNTPAVTSVN